MAAALATPRYASNLDESSVLPRQLLWLANAIGIGVAVAFVASRGPQYSQVALTFAGMVSALGLTCTCANSVEYCTYWAPVAAALGMATGALAFPVVPLTAGSHLVLQSYVIPLAFCGVLFYLFDGVVKRAENKEKFDGIVE